MCACISSVKMLHVHVIAEHSEANNVVYSRFHNISIYYNYKIIIYIYIYIYINIYMSAQDHAHRTQVLSQRPIVHCPLEHWLLIGAPL